VNIIQLEPSKLKDYSNNARKHPAPQIAQLIHSIEEFGFNVPVECNANFVILSGHARVEAAKKMGLATIPVIVQHHLADDTKQKGYILAANKIAMNAEWDHELLIAELEELRNAPDFDMSLTGFSTEELNEMLGDMDLNGQELGDPDEIPEPPTVPVSEKGDVWLLGNHRLMCGDSTVITDVEILMDGKLADMVFTDPPYNTGMTAETQKGSGGLWKETKGSKSGRLSNMFNDSYTDDDWQEFMSLFTANYYIIMKQDSVAYICLDWRRNHQLIPHIDTAGFKRSNLIVWDKMVHGLGSDYKYCHEFINVCKKGKPVLHTNQGSEKEYYDIWHIQRKMGTDKEHATKKPVELVERAINHSTTNSSLVTDLFGGSGSTLIACEKLNRTCYMMELDPIYVDTIIKRYQTYTGKSVVHEYSGKKWDEMNTLV